MDQLLAAGAEAVGEGFYERMKKTADGGGTPLEVGAALAVYLGSAASDGITGKPAVRAVGSVGRAASSIAGTSMPPTSTPCAASSRRIAARHGASR